MRADCPLVRCAVVRAIVLLFLGAMTAACGVAIKFSADTRVASDGRATRSTLLAVSGDSGYDEVLARYELPSGGAWVDLPEPAPSYSDESEPAARSYSRGYALEREFMASDEITPDYIRYNEDRTAAARNRIAVEISRSLFADSYRYEESFADIVSPASFTTVLRELADTYIRALAEEMAATPRVGVELTEAEDRIRSWAAPLIDRFLAVFDSECVRAQSGLNDCSAALEQDPLLGPGARLFESGGITGLIETLFPAPAGTDSEDWVYDLETELTERLDARQDLDAWDSERTAEQLFGVHGFVLFKDYPFEISVSLPGTYLETNAHARAGDALTWSFENEAFWVVDYRLFARSRVLHADRFILLSIVLVVLMAFAGVLSERRRKIPSGGRAS